MRTCTSKPSATSFRRACASCYLLVELLWAAFAVSLVVLGYMVSRVAALQESPGLEIPMSYPYYSMVAGGAYLGLVAARRLAGWYAKHFTRSAA